MGIVGLRRKERHEIVDLNLVKNSQAGSKMLEELCLPSGRMMCRGAWMYLSLKDCVLLLQQLNFFFYHPTSLRPSPMTTSTSTS
jgi:hypothetical protein